MLDPKGKLAAFALVTACAAGQGRDEGGTPPLTTTTTGGATTDDGSSASSETTATPDTATTSTGHDLATTSASTTTSSTTDAITGTGPDATTDDTGPTAGCGDGVVQPPELCDDGGLVDGDGCNADCRPSGELLWSTTHAGMLGLTDEALGCAVDGNSSIYVTGFVGVGPGDDDLWLRKYAEDGSVLWTQTHAGGALLKDQGRAIVVDVAELVYVAGYAQEPMEGNDVVVRKYAADGSPLWTRSFKGAAMLSDVASGAAFTPEGDLIVGGATSVLNAGNDTWLRKYGPAGDVLWTRTYNGAASINDATQAVAVTPDGYIYAAGYEAVPGESNNLWLGKYDADGNLLWSRLYSGAAGKADYLHGVVTMDDGGAVVCGYEVADGVPWKSFVRRYDPAGLTVWTEVEEGPEAAGALCYGLGRTADGDILFAGATIQGGAREPWLRRLAPDGAPRWSTVIAGAGPSASHARCIRPAPDGTLVVAGGVDDGVDGRDVWIARLSP